MREELRGGYMKWRDDFVSSLGPNKVGGDHPPMDCHTNANAIGETAHHLTISSHVGGGGESSLLSGGFAIIRPAELVEGYADTDENGKKYGKTFGLGNFTGGSMVTRPGELVDDDGDADENGKKYGKTFGMSISNDEIVSSYSTSGRGVSVY